MSSFSLKIVVTIAIVCLMACHKTQPQIPTRHGQKRETPADTLLLKAIETNQRLAQEADKAISNYANEGYAQYETGFWAKTLREVDNPLQEGEKVMVHYRVYSMDDVLLEDIREAVVMGKSTRIQAVTEALYMMERGEKVSLIVPWYLAYGATGNETVAPYTNLRVELEVEK